MANIISQELEEIFLFIKLQLIFIYGQINTNGQRFLDLLATRQYDVDSDENIEEDNLVWVDDRKKETWVKYDGYLVEKYVDERSNRPKFNEVCGHKLPVARNKGNVYGLSIVNDLIAPHRQDLEQQMLDQQTMNQRLLREMETLKAEKNKQIETSTPLAPRILDFGTSGMSG
ncbi:hypothetical protein R6Q59_035622 [Mikania micrantha]